MSNWWVASFPANMPGGVAQGGQGGYGTDALTARDSLDAKRMAAGFAPGASYPDGYLGAITDRQEDKMMAVLQTRLTSTSYQRGVHKGALVGPQAYFWNEDMDPEMGLARQSAARPEDVEGGMVLMTRRFAPTGDPVEMLVNDGKAPKPDAPQVPLAVSDPARLARMRPDLPRWV